MAPGPSQTAVRTKRTFEDAPARAELEVLRRSAPFNLGFNCSVVRLSRLRLAPRWTEENA